MILFHEFIKISRLSDLDRRLVDPVVVANRGRIAPTLVDRNLLGEPLRTNRGSESIREISVDKGKTVTCGIEGLSLGVSKKS